MMSIIHAVDLVMAQNHMKHKAYQHRFEWVFEAGD